MAIYSLALRTTNFTSSQACVEIYTPSTTSCTIFEISIFQATATASTYGLGRPAAQGITPVAVPFQAESSTSDPASLVNASLSWGTSPTAPAQYLRRANSAASIGPVTVWTFPKGLYLPPSASLVIFNVTTTDASDINFVINQ